MSALAERATRLNDEQLAAVEAAGSAFVSAGAGTGKTSVLVERYVRAVCERGLDVDSMNRGGTHGSPASPLLYVCVPLGHDGAPAGQSPAPPAKPQCRRIRRSTQWQ